MKTAFRVLKAVIVVLIICGFAPADQFIKGFIDWRVFFAESGLFWALAGICVYKLRRTEE